MTNHLQGGNLHCISSIWKKRPFVGLHLPQIVNIRFLTSHNCGDGRPECYQISMNPRGAGTLLWRKRSRKSVHLCTTQHANYLLFSQKGPLFCTSAHPLEKDAKFLDHASPSPAPHTNKTGYRLFSR